MTPWTVTSTSVSNDGEDRDCRNSPFLLCVNEHRFAEVEFVLDAPQHSIVDAAFIAQTDCSLAFYPQCLERQCKMALVIADFTGSGIDFQTRQPLAVVVGQILIHLLRWVGVASARIFEMSERGLGYDSTR